MSQEGESLQQNGHCKNSACNREGPAGSLEEALEFLRRATSAEGERKRRRGLEGIRRVI